MNEGDVLKFARVRDFDGSTGVVDDEGDLQEMVDDHLVKNVDTDGDGVEDSAYFNVGGYGIALEDYLF